MRREILIFAAALCGLIFMLGCGDGEESETVLPEVTEWALPYQRIPVGDEDPGDNGPDDSLVLNAMPENMGGVPFTHFTHASNTEDGYRIPCQVCHHNVALGEEPSESCTECHQSPEEGSDPAHGGPDDNMLLIGEHQDPSRVLPVPFTHFTHASNQGHKLACESCHHTGDLMACDDCHESVAIISDDGKVIPKMKRAAHLQCKACHKAVNDRHPEAPAPATCDGCHTLEPPRRLAGSLSLDRAYHLSCVGCHQRVALAVPEARAPGGDCAGCHSFESIGGSFDGPGTTSDMLSEDELGPEDLMITLGVDKKPPTPFPHQLHQDIADNCETCHHEGLDVATCSDCHESEEAKGIYHQLCIGCHKELDAPSKCADCHPKP